jgi:hypothetical protein
LDSVGLEATRDVLRLNCSHLTELRLSAQKNVNEDSDIGSSLVSKLGFGTDPALSLPLLTHITIWDVTMSDAELFALTATVTHLTEFAMSRCDALSYAGFRNIWEQARGLQELEVVQCPLMRGVVSIARHCHQLHTLSLVDAYVSLNEICEAMGILPRLKHLTLSDVDDKVVLEIANTQPHLLTIAIGGINEEAVSSASLTRLFTACRKLTSVTLRDCPSLTAQNLLEMSPLTSFGLDYNFNLTDTDVLQFAGKNPALTELRMSICPHLTQQLPLPLLRSCPLLTSLILGNAERDYGAMHDLVRALIPALYPAMQKVDVYLGEF